LAVLDVALVGTALKSTSTSPVEADPTSAAAPAPVSNAPSPSATAGAGKAIDARGPLQTMLVARDSQRAWRVGAGSCTAGGGTVLSTVDGGKSWTKGETKLRRIVRVQPADNGAAFVIGANSSCAAELKDTTDGGVTWAGGGNVGRAWFRDPGNPMVLQAPGPTTSKPCGRRPVLDLAVLATGAARVLCGDGVIRSTTQGGSAWTVVGTVGGAVALAVPALSSTQTYVARLGDPSCAGVQIMRVRRRVALSCIRTSIPMGAGQIALSVTDGGGWLAVGKMTMRSTDGLLTWKVSSRDL
jgi:photosystem II stability/assembly factor-like uncharacterized protein